MKMIRITLLLCTFIFISIPSSFSQQYIRCSSSEYNTRNMLLNSDFATSHVAAMNASEQWILQHPEQEQAVIVIPVVVHIVYKTTAENISDAKVISQISSLNKDFSRQNSDTNLIPSVWKSIAANCEIQFCLASTDTAGNPTSGITRTNTTVSSFTDDDKVKKTSTGGCPPWDRNKYLNLWVCNLSGNLLGYTQSVGGPAATDGVVVNYVAFGNPGISSPFDKGRTATHEIGHWLGLDHTWGDDAPGSCTGTDNISDTPNQADASQGCHTFPFTDACSTTSPGIMFMNYMDYSDDACMYMFTSGQKTKMTSVLNTTRASIKTSNKCVLGIDDKNNSGGFSIHPNPVSRVLNITCNSQKAQTATVFNILGEVILSMQVPFSNQFEISVNTLPDGLYILQLNSDTENTSQKFIVNKNQ